MLHELGSIVRGPTSLTTVLSCVRAVYPSSDTRKQTFEKKVLYTIPPWPRYTHRTSEAAKRFFSCCSRCARWIRHPCRTTTIVGTLRCFRAMFNPELCHVVLVGKQPPSTWNGSSKVAKGRCRITRAPRPNPAEPGRSK